jgi:chitinase
LYAFFDVTPTCEIKTLDDYADFDKAYDNECIKQGWNTGDKRGTVDALSQMREKYPHVKLIFSLGGWTKSTNFSHCASTAEFRSKFAAGCKDLLQKTGWDGIDLDWEYPVEGNSGAPGTPQDPQNYLSLFKAVRASMNEISGDKLLTMAEGMGPLILGNMEPVMKDICDELDYVNTMSYDYAGGWNKFTGHNAPLFHSGNAKHSEGFDVNWGIQKMKSLGCDPKKLVMGLPFYGRSWSGVEPGPNGDGLWADAKAAGCGSWEAGSLDYTDIKENYLKSFDEHWDDVTKTPYLYNPKSKDFITYDNPRSIKEKVDYANAQGLGGVMFWELSGDRDAELMDTIVENLDTCSSSRRLELPGFMALHV